MLARLQNGYSDGHVPSNKCFFGRVVDWYHFSGMPTIRPLKQRLKHSGILGDWIAKDLLEDGYNIRPVRKLVLTGT